MFIEEVVNLVSFQGDDVTWELTVLQGTGNPNSIIPEEGTPINMGSWLFQGYVRERYNGPKLVEFSFDTSDAADGKLRFTLTKEQTASLKVKKKQATYVYDIEGTDTLSKTRKIASGSLQIIHEVTYE